MLKSCNIASRTKTRYFQALDNFLDCILHSDYRDTHGHLMDDLRRFKDVLRVMRTREDSELRLRAAQPASRRLDLVSRILFRDRRYYARSSQGSAGRENTTSEQYRPREQVLTTPAAGAGRVDTPIPPPCPIAPVSPAESDVSNESDGRVGPARHRSVPSAMRQFLESLSISPLVLSRLGGTTFMHCIGMVRPFRSFVILIISSLFLTFALNSEVGNGQR